LSGVAAPVEVRCGKAAFREAALFTHRGLSGPAILQISSYWRHGDAIEVDFLPDTPRGWLRNAKRDTPRASVRRALAARLPDRLAETLADRLALDKSLADTPDRRLEAAEARLTAWTFHPNGTEGFAKASMQWITFDDDGNCIGSNLMDYLIPTAWETPRFELDETVTPSPHHPIGAKGVGESATVGSPAAYVNAVIDALRPFGITNIDMPVLPHRVWSAVREAQAG